MVHRPNRLVGAVIAALAALPASGAGTGSCLVELSAPSPLAVALDSQAQLLAVGSPYEAAPAVGARAALDNVGIVGVYARNDARQWMKRATLVASNAGPGDMFGMSVAVSADGKTIAVGAINEDSVGTRADDDNALDAGAVYVYARDGEQWRQQAYLKASKPARGDNFGSVLALSVDGNTLAVYGANNAGKPEPERSSTPASGGIYVFNRQDGEWKGPTLLAPAGFPREAGLAPAIALSADATTLIAGGSVPRVYALGPQGWRQSAALSRKREVADDGFGMAVALSPDGEWLAIGAPGDDYTSVAEYEAGKPAAALEDERGAVLIYRRTPEGWHEAAYLKPAVSEHSAAFGQKLAFSAGDPLLAVSAPQQPVSLAGGTEVVSSGAVYLFRPSLNDKQWAEVGRLHASHPASEQQFGSDLAWSGDGGVLAMIDSRTPAIALWARSTSECLPER